MNRYLIDYQEKATLIIDTNDNKPKAVIRNPELGEEIELPVKYQVRDPNGPPIGELFSYIPEQGRILMKSGKEMHILSIGKNEELVLRTTSKTYDIGKFSLEDIALEEERKDMESNGFSYGYNARHPDETGKLRFFRQQNTRERGYLDLPISDFLPFIPLIMYDRIKNNILGKKIKEDLPEIEQESGFEEGNFAKFVKANFKPRFLSDAFSYQDQNGEKQRFFTYADDKKRPIILNGPTGNGKSVLAMDYACSRGLPYYFDTGSSSFRLATATGKFVPSSPSPVFSPGSLTLAAIFGGVYVLEEMPPIPQDELTGLNIFLERRELPIITHFGYETIRADPNFSFIATGNFHSNYTTNELNDALLQRFRQLKFGYAAKESTIQILSARAPKLDYPTAEIIATALEEMRLIARSHSKDLGLKGAVDIVQLLTAGNKTPLKELFEDNIINPITTYENNIEKKDGKLYSKLMEIVNKYV